MPVYTAEQRKVVEDWVFLVRIFPEASMGEVVVTGGKVA